MKRTKLLSFRVIMLSLMTLMTFSLFAQRITVSGTVTDDTGMPVIGATIIVVNETTRGTVTDIDGNYTLSNVPADGSIRFSYVGRRNRLYPCRDAAASMWYCFRIQNCWMRW